MISAVEKSVGESLGQRSVWNKRPGRAVRGYWETVGWKWPRELFPVLQEANPAFWLPPSHGLAVVLANHGQAMTWMGTLQKEGAELNRQLYVSLIPLLWQSYRFSVLSFTSSSKTLIPEADYSWIFKCAAVPSSPLMAPGTLRGCDAVTQKVFKNLSLQADIPTGCILAVSEALLSQGGY